VSRKSNQKQGVKPSHNRALRSALAVDTSKDFPGARGMGLSFKQAVEKFVRLKYGRRVGKDLTKADIFRDDKKLYAAIDHYERQCGHAPFDIPSVRDLAHERFERVLAQGMKNVSRRDRDAAHKMAKRLDKAAHG
jgi:hypothetical protein